ncbi:ankyrin repeat domain-containing protein 30B-like isoform X2 [Pan troglodytes]|uniref:ankyrin repeat domain-containing protein 30B-like isoform X2 n=1 Tax=Pan troglodytes TaxID=9598 RepID=UPI00301329C4
MAESLVEKPPDEAAPLVEGTADKIQCLGKATSGKFEQSAEETPKKIMRTAKETSEKFAWPAKERPRKITWEEKETSVKTECVAGVTPNKTEVLEKGTSKMLTCPTKETSTKASTNDKMPTSESGQKEDTKSPSVSEVTAMDVEEIGKASPLKIEAAAA